MLIGFVCAVGAGLLWGLVFVVPTILPEYPGVLLSFGRYSAFGLIALIPACLSRNRMAALSGADWLAALKLSLVGNLVYYAALACAVQRADAPLPAMLIGTLPIIISICSNWVPGHPSERIAWRRLLPSLLVLFVGILLVNGSELAHAGERHSAGDYTLGGATTLIALAAWTWYPIKNAQYLRAHPHIHASTWASAQGLAILPPALLGFAACGWYLQRNGSGYLFPFGGRPGPFIWLMLATGLGASWLGSILWNQASRRLPTSLAGQLIVFETLAALAYTFMLRAALPPPQLLAGALLLCVGVAMGVRAFRA